MSADIHKVIWWLRFNGFSDRAKQLEDAWEKSEEFYMAEISRLAGLLTPEQLKADLISRGIDVDAFQTKAWAIISQKIKER